MLAEGLRPQGAPPRVARQAQVPLVQLGTICVYLTVAGVPAILTGWLPTLEDLLAEDWEEVGE